MTFPIHESHEPLSKTVKSYYSRGAHELNKSGVTWKRLPKPTRYALESQEQLIDLMCKKPNHSEDELRTMCEHWLKCLLQGIEESATLWGGLNDMVEKRRAQ